MKKFFTSPFIIIVIVCFVIAISIPLFVSNSEKREVKSVTKKINPTSTLSPSKPLGRDSGLSQNDGFISPTQVVQGTSTSSNKQQETQPTVIPTSSPTQVTQTFQVSLSINGSSVGSVAVPMGGNQCDVLTGARDQGKIASLLMKYDNNLGTNGVYQINAIGKENSIWWVYKVNGQSPSQGCSLVKANSGDSVEWEYKGN